MDSLAKKRRLGLVVGGLVHVPYIRGSDDGFDRAYASCMYSSFLTSADPMPVNSHEFVDRLVNCLRCIIARMVLFNDAEMALLEDRNMAAAATLMIERGIPLPVAKEAVFNWQAEVDADMD